METSAEEIWLNREVTAPFLRARRSRLARVHTPCEATRRGLANPILTRAPMRSDRSRFSLSLALACLAVPVAARGQDESAAAPADTQATAFGVHRQKAFDWLLTQQKDGVFFIETPRGKHPDTGLTGLAVAALQTKPVALRSEAEQTVIDAGLEHLLGQVNEDGSIGKRVVNYTTCAAVFALDAADRKEFAPVIKGARDYVLTIQNIESRGHARSDRDYGSIGYEGDSRGDLSNLQFAVQAWHAADLDEEHEAFAKAIVFLQRTQNLPKFNDFEGATKIDGGEELAKVRSGTDGGGVYYPGQSAVGYVSLGDGAFAPRSYGSMTYSLLKTYTLCGVGADDERVRAALKWVSEHWDLDVNPGAPADADEEAHYQGLFYYYMVLAQALDLLEVESVETPDGAVDWRAALATKLQSMQREDGTWLNPGSQRWWEGTTALCTIYALLALDRCAQ